MNAWDNEPTPLTDAAINKCCNRPNRQHVDADHARELERQLRYARKVLATLQPFVMEDFYPNCATPDYKDAVTKMNEYLAATESEG